jgi:hypothetical protein
VALGVDIIQMIVIFVHLAADLLEELEAAGFV